MTNVWDSHLAMFSCSLDDCRHGFIAASCVACKVSERSERDKGATAPLFAVDVDTMRVAGAWLETTFQTELHVSLRWLEDQEARVLDAIDATYAFSGESPLADAFLAGKADARTLLRREHDARHGI